MVTAIGVGIAAQKSGKNREFLPSTPISPSTGGLKQEIRPVVGTHGIEILIASVQNIVAERDADLARGSDNVSDQ